MQSHLYNNRRLKQFLCKKCGNRFSTGEDYKRHMINEHDAILLPITMEDIMKIQSFLLDSKCEKASELYEIFMIGKLLKSK